MKVNVKTKIVELRGTGDICSSNSRYLYNDILFIVLNASIAQETQLIADYLGIENDGIFGTSLYKQNSLKEIKKYLARIGYKVSKMNIKEAFDTLYLHFDAKEKSCQS